MKMLRVTLVALALSFIVTPLCYSVTLVDIQLRNAAIYDNSLRQTRNALLNGANPNTHNGAGDTPLHYATWRGNAKIVQLLLSTKANINAQNERGNTPLHFAVIYGHLAIVKLLLNAGANTKLKTIIAKDTALNLAKQENNQDIVKTLEEYLVLQKEVQENPTGETLRKAIQDNYPTIVKLLLQKCIDVDKTNLELAKQLNHRTIGLMLVKYLDAITGQYYISKNGIVNSSITPDIACMIMSTII